MALEWIRRQDPALDEQLRLYLFTSGPIISLEGSDDANSAAASSSTGTPPIGNLRGAS
jgi:hypothetical protein